MPILLRVAVRRALYVILFLLPLAAAPTSRTQQAHVPDAKPAERPDDALLKGIADGDVDAVRSALQRGANPNGPGEGRRVLGKAIAQNDWILVRELIRAGAEPNATTLDDNRVPMLYLAIDFNNGRVVDILLKAGANPEYMGPRLPLRPLAYAARVGAPNVCRPLVEAGANVNSWNLWPETTYSTSEVNRAPEAAARGTGIPPSNRGRTPLMIAASEGHAAVVQALLLLGADVTLENERGETAFKLAGSVTNPVERIRALLTNPALRR